MSTYIPKEIPSDTREILFLIVVEKPRWDDQEDLRWKIPSNLVIGSITWIDLDFYGTHQVNSYSSLIRNGYSAYIENNEHTVNYDPKYFSPISKEVYYAELARVQVNQMFNP